MDMKITTAIDYNPKKTQYIAVHHSGSKGGNSYASTANETAEEVNEAHKTRWNFASGYMKDANGRPYYGGYNFFIDALGNITQFRAIGEETAAQMGYNFNGEVISICLAGNFTIGVDTPTGAQIEALRDLRTTLNNRGMGVMDYNVVPHRHFGDTQCYGNALPDDWARNVSRPNVIVVPEVKDDASNIEIKEKISLIQTLIAALSRLIDLRRKVFGNNAIYRIGTRVSIFDHPQQPDC